MGDITSLFLLARREEKEPVVPIVPILDSDPSPTVNAATWTMCAVATIFLGLRIYCKQIKARGMWWDDYLLIVAWMFMVAANGILTELMRIGFGITLAFVPHMHTLSTTVDVLSKIGLALTKTSFAVTLLRVAQKWQKYFIWFLIVTMNLLLATNAVTTWKAACDRVGDAYEAVLPGACWRVEDSVIMAMVANGYSALADFCLALLPWVIVWNLQMKRHEKIGVAVAMSLGIIAGVVGVIKVVKALTITAGPDIPYRLSLLFIWGFAEPYVTIVATSIPPLRVLFKDARRSKYPSRSFQHPGSGDARSTPRRKFPRSNMTTGTLERLDSEDGSELSILPSDRVKMERIVSRVDQK